MSLGDLHFNFPGGKLKLINLTTGVGAVATTLPVRPPVGKEWWIIDLWCYHDDSQNHTVIWNWQEAADVFQCSTGRSIGALNVMEFAQDRGGTIYKPGRFPIVATNGIFPSMSFSVNLNAGKKYYLFAVVLEIDAY